MMIRRAFTATLLFSALFISCNSSSSSEAYNVKPMSRSTVKETLTAGADDRLAVRSYEGCVAVPAKDPLKKIAVGFDLTGESCTITVKAGNLVSVSFLGQDVSVVRYSIADVFVGEISQDRVLVVQWLEETGEVLDVNQTVYDSKGIVVYGNSGDGDYINSCHIPRTTNKNKSCS